MLTEYLTQTQRLLQNPAAPTSLYSPADLDVYINEARVQLAGEAVCIPVIGTLAVIANDQGPYLFTAINLGAAIGVAGVLNIQTIWVQIGTGQQWIRPRPWPWFTLYEMNNAAPVPTGPRAWAQYGQGINGSIYLNMPDAAYTLNVDTICYPIPLVDDTTAEAIPPLWQTAIPYYAAYLALLSSQTGARTQEADAMLQRYELFVKRARQFATPQVLPLMYAQSPSPVTGNQLGQGGAPG